MTESQKSPEDAQKIRPKRPTRMSWPSVVASALVLALALLLSDPKLVARELAGVDLFWLAPAFAVACFQLLLLGLRWSRFARVLGVELGFFRATLEYALSVPLNLVLPSGFAGDGYRAFRHNRIVPGRGALRIVEALALDRVSGQLALAMVVILGLPFGVTREILDLGSVGMTLVTVTVIVAVGTWMVRRVRRFNALAESLGRLAARAARLLFSPRSLVWHLPLSMLFTLASVTQLYIASRALQVPLGFSELLWAGPLILLAASLPSFYGGWGVREGASGLVFAALNLPPGLGVAVSVVYGAFGLIVHSPGLLVLFVNTDPVGTRAESKSSQ